MCIRDRGHLPGLGLDDVGALADIRIDGAANSLVGGVDVRDRVITDPLRDDPELGVGLVVVGLLLRRDPVAETGHSSLHRLQLPVCRIELVHGRAGRAQVLGMFLQRPAHHTEGRRRTRGELQHSADSGGGPIAGSALTPGTAQPRQSPGAVSYTHLDVYKRQATLMALPDGSLQVLMRLP